MNRRRFLAATSILGVAALPNLSFAASRESWWRTAHGLSTPVDPLEPAVLQRLVSIALDAARQGGAVYADAFIRIVDEEHWGAAAGRIGAPSFYSRMYVGVRAFSHDCWGVAAFDGIPSERDIAEMGHNAAAQAKRGATPELSPIVLAAAPSVQSGEWTMPVEIDPFTIPVAEKADVLTAILDDLERARYRLSARTFQATFQRERRTMMSTDGTRCMQTLFNTSGRLGLGIEIPHSKRSTDPWLGDFLTPRGAGWEYLLRAPYRESLPEWVAMAERNATASQPEMGRHEVVFSAHAVATLLDATLGAATNAERIMGRRMQDVGTSFIDDPETMIGALTIAGPNVTVTMDRTVPGGAATVAWDDEGVAATEATLVRDGTLWDLQTSRESASWLAPVYAKNGRSVRSNGCAGWESRRAFPLQATPNLALAPGKDDLAFLDLVKRVDRGYAVLGVIPRVDWQGLNGSGTPIAMYAIRDGQLREAVNTSGVELLFRTPDLWKSVVGIGGPRSQEPFGFLEARNDMGLAHTVRAVPMHVSQLRFALHPRGR